jgi:hypothetical protein
MDSTLIIGALMLVFTITSIVNGISIQALKARIGFERKQWELERDALHGEIARLNKNPFIILGQKKTA